MAEIYGAKSWLRESDTERGCICLENSPFSRRLNGGWSVSGEVGLRGLLRTPRGSEMQRLTVLGDINVPSSQHG